MNKNQAALKDKAFVERSRNFFCTVLEGESDLEELQFSVKYLLLALHTLSLLSSIQFFFTALEYLMSFISRSSFSFYFEPLLFLLVLLFTLQCILF